MANTEIIEEITASSDSTKALPSSPSANNHQNAASSSATTNENDQDEEAHPPSFETIRNDLRNVNLAWKKYKAHINAKIYVAGKEFKRLRNLGSTEKDFDELQKAIANLQIPRIPSQENIVSPAKTKDKSSKPSLAANYMAKYFSSKPSRSKMIRNDLRLVNLAWKKYTDHMNAKISVASKVFKRLQRKYPDHTNAQNNKAREESKKTAFEKLQKAIENLKSQVKEWQMPQIPLTSNEDDQDGGRAFYQMIGSELNLLVSAFDEAQKFKETDFDKFQKAIENLKSQVKEMQIPLTFNEDDHDGGALSQMMGQLDLLASAFDEGQKFKEKDLDKFQKAIVNLKSQVEELQIPLTSKEALSQMFGSDLDLLNSALEDFDKLQTAIKNQKSQGKELQIPSTSNKDNHDGGALSQMFGSNPDLLDSGFEEGKNFMERTGGEINQLARAKSNELQKPNSENQQNGESSKLRKDIGKLRVVIRSYGEICSSSGSNRHPYEWPNINGLKDGRRHFFFKESSQPNTEGADGRRHFFSKESYQPVLDCLLCFFKFPPEAFIGRTMMIYLWIGQGYILQHLKKKYRSKEEELLCLEEDAGKTIFDELITNGFIERCSLEPNRCRMSPSSRSSFYKEAEAKGFTSNGTLDLGPESVRDKLCLINVGEAIINCKPEIFANMEHIRSLYLGRWQTSAMHHIELADSKIHHRMNKLVDTKILHGINKLKSLSFLSLRGISMITELPKFISELNDLKILDLRACHNLEAIPDEIGSLQKLTHLDMSECYFLEHMPKSLSQLSKLEVLKGFFIGDSGNNRQSCTLSDLREMSKLRKLNIYTSVKKFPATSDLNALRAFQGLLKLTISWGGFSSPIETVFTAALASQEEGSQEEGENTLHPKLQKLDLRGFPEENLPYWLRPLDLKELRKLYIGGGNLCDLGQVRENQGEHWNVEILRLKYLDALETDWSKLMILFPKLIYLHKKKCSKINFQGDERSVWSEWKGKESSVWMHKKAIDTRLRLQQKFFRSDVNSINLSSLLGYNQKIAQRNSNIQ